MRHSDFTASLFNCRQIFCSIFKNASGCPHPVPASGTDICDFSVKVPGELMG